MVAGDVREIGSGDARAGVEPCSAVRGEVAAGDVLEHVERLVGDGLVELVEPHDMWAGEPSEQSRLGDEAFADVGVEAVMVGEQLDRHVAADAVVGGEVHRRERPGSEQPAHPEPPDRYR